MLQACAYFLSLGYKYQTRPSVVRSFRPEVCLVEFPANPPIHPPTLPPDQVIPLPISSSRPEPATQKCANTNCKLRPSISGTYARILTLIVSEWEITTGDAGCVSVGYSIPPTKLINTRVSALSRPVLYRRGEGLQLPKLQGEQSSQTHRPELRLH